MSSSGVEKIYEVYGTRNNLLFNEENILDYRPGGYHPVALGDAVKDGRYIIRHKLGYGGFSTVWAARDKELERWVAVKIYIADEATSARELNIFRGLAEHSRGDRVAKYIVQLLDTFQVEGPNGKHQCLVFEILGPTLRLELDEYHRTKEPIDIDTVIDFSMQLLQAVALLHEAGYAHGDLSTRNIAVASSVLANASEEQLFGILTLPQAKPVVRQDGKCLGPGVPTHLVRSAQWLGWPDQDEETDYEIRLIDFGEAFRPNTIPKKLAQPLGLQAPETIFGGAYDYRVDLWRVGLIIYNIAMGHVGFGFWDQCGYVESVIEFAGEFPREWQSSWLKMRCEAGADIESSRSRPLLSGSVLEQSFRESIHDAHLQILLPVIKGLTRLRPSDRISASQALAMVEAEWLGSDDSD